MKYIFFLGFFAAARIASASAGTVTGGAVSASTQPLDPVTFVASFYRFALIIAGTLAFAVIVWAGIRYSLSGGNSSSQSEAKAWIWAALSGLLLLAGAYLLLSTISPNLVNLHIGKLETLPQAAALPPQPVSTPDQSCKDTCAAQCANQTDPEVIQTCLN